MDKIPQGIDLMDWLNLNKRRRRHLSSLVRQVGSSDERAFKKRVAKRRKKKGYR